MSMGHKHWVKVQVRRLSKRAP